MSEWIEDLASRLVAGRKRDGRCVYDPQAKRELILACCEPGVSVSKLAQACGVNANQLSTWVSRYMREAAEASRPRDDDVVEVRPSTFVPVHIEVAAPSATPAQDSAQVSVAVDMQARLPNGVVVDLRGCDMQQAGDLIQMLGRLRCSASTKA